MGCLSQTRFNHAYNVTMLARRTRQSLVDAIDGTPLLSTLMNYDRLIDLFGVVALQVHVREDFNRDPIMGWSKNQLWENRNALDCEILRWPPPLPPLHLRVNKFHLSRE